MRNSIFELISGEIFKPRLIHFPKRRVTSQHPNDIWSIDLVDIPALAEVNDGYRYMLNVVDCFSRYAWSVALKDKKGQSIVDAFKTIVKENDNQYPGHLWSDQGSEFINMHMRKWCDEFNIIQYQTYGSSKSAIVERFNRTIKTNLWKQFTIQKSHRWIDILPNVIKKYNNTKHRSIGMTPRHAHILTGDALAELYAKQYGSIPAKNKNKNKFNIGDVVRISRLKGVFDKGYYPNWSMELFRITKILNTVPWTYHIEDLASKPIQGSFYEQELQVSKQDPKEGEFLIEKILQTRTRKGKRQAFVKWLGYSDDSNSWIDI